MMMPRAIGRYQVRDRLGQGGMGVLYMALDPAIDRLVALKLLRVNQAEIRERFLREARLAARLQHPNIVTIFDVGEHEGQPFIAMEYIPGETLAEMISRRAPLPLGRRLELIVDACKGLAFAHKHGVVHRDVKPANLMISRDSGVLKVLDFGIARGVDSNLTQAGMLMGTPSYMSPELLEGHAVDHRSDIFALGLVLYEVLSYRQAFSGETPHAVWQKVASEQPPSILEFNPSLDPALAAIIDTAIAKRVEDRYPDLDRLRAELQRVIHRLDAEQAGATAVGDPPPIAATPATPARRSGVARVAERRAAQIAAHLDRAEEALEARDLDRAQEAVEEAAMLDPDDARVLTLLDRVRRELEAVEVAGWMADAEAAIRAGALTTAAGLVNRVLQTMPNHLPALELRTALQQAVEARERAQERARAVARALEQAEEHFTAGGLDAALRATSEALGLDPQSSAALELRERIQRAAAARITEAIGLARAEAASERFGTALRRLEQLSPRDARVETVEHEIREAWQAAERRKQQEEADRRAHDEAARLRNEASRQLRQGRELLAAGDFAAAIAVTDAVLGSDPSRSDARELRQEIERARKAQDARREHDEQVRRALARARAQAEEGRHGEAIAALEPFQDAPAAAALIATLRSTVAELEARARADTERQARDAHDRRVVAAIAKAHELLEQQRGDEALAALEGFGAADHRILGMIATLREARHRMEAERATEDARAAEAADRAKRDADEGRLGAAIARLERFLPRHPVTDAALEAMRATHERNAHAASSRALALAAKGREAEAFETLQQFDPPHPVVADAVIRLKAESAAREARRQADAAAQQSAADAQAQRQALDAWVTTHGERGRSALAGGRFNEAKQIAQTVLARVPDSMQAAQILDEAVARQAEAEAAAARRVEVSRAMAMAAAALDAADPAMARAHLDAAAAVGAAAAELAPLRDRTAALEAEQEARRRRALHDRRAAAAVDAARALFDSGEEDAALRRLERFDPPHPEVSAALGELRAARAALEQQRQEALAAERARAAAITLPDEAAIAADEDAFEFDAPLEPVSAHASAAERGGLPQPAAQAKRRRTVGLLAIAAVALLVVAGTAIRLMQNEAAVGADKRVSSPVDTGDGKNAAGKNVSPAGGVGSPGVPSTTAPPIDTPPATVKVETPQPTPGAIVNAALVIDAAPWGQVTRIAHVETQNVMPLDAERNTPYVAQLPEGTYEVTVQRFDQSQRRRVTLRGSVESRLLFEFEPVDVDEYLRRMGS